MTQIDPFKVMRNSETLASFRAWSKETGAKGQPFVIVGLISTLVGLALFFADMDHHSEFVRGVGAALCAVGPALTMTGLALVARFRKLHPWTPS